ncbi:hypothetical protein [Solicola sp. PLA-1-18]|uniref:hypothetical protein n=1 Tax=Solicola sp. PLA-1-18 TaxID=3380532 RepID=UPI003B828D5A
MSPMPYRTVHVLDGYLLDDGQVRARCECGFLTLKQRTQVRARAQLATTHGLTPIMCVGCGRDEPDWVAAGLPASLTIDPDPITGDDVIICTPGAGGCQMTLALHQV